MWRLRGDTTNTGDGSASTSAGAPPSFVNVCDVSHVYRTRNGVIHALDHVNLHVAENAFVCLLGPSGCGKSTLLRLISGVIRATGGFIELEGRRVDRPQTNLGIVFQEDLLLEWRTTLKNIMLQCEIRRLDGRHYATRAQELVDLVGLSGFEHALPGELSGGMRQRVAVCRALVHDAPLLLMDEPFGSIDALTRDQMNLDLLRIWEQRRKTVVFVTHSIPEAIFLGDVVVVFTPRPGRVTATIDIDLPRPRHLAVRDTPEFISYNRRVRRIFEETGILRETG